MTTSDARLRVTVELDRRRITAGERPVYHVTWATSLDGAADVTIAELPIIHVIARSAETTPAHRGVPADGRDRGLPPGLRRVAADVLYDEAGKRARVMRALA